MEDYKAKFEKLIRRIDDLIVNGWIDEKVGKVILKDFALESEDENIRKAILELVKQSSDILNPMNQKSMIDWLEKQGEQKQNVTDIISDLKNYFATTTKEQQEKDWDEIKKWVEKHFNHDRHIEINPTNKVEPKFKVGDWITNGIDVDKIIGIDLEDEDYLFENNRKSDISLVESISHIWTIQDAKDGDVLVASDGSIFPFAGVDDCACKYYVALTTDNVVNFNVGLKHYWGTSRAVHPATKEQQDTLEKAMADAGYTFDFEKKELKKIEQKSAECKQETKPNGGIVREDFNEGEGYYKVNLAYLSKSQVELIENLVASWQNPTNNTGECGKNKRLHTIDVYYPNCCLEVKEAIEQGIACCKTEKKEILISLNGIFLRITPSSTTENVLNEYNNCTGNNTVIKEKTNLINQWNSNDESYLKGIITDIECEVLCANCSREIADLKINWLKSLKDRVQQQPKQEWSEEDEKLLDAMIDMATNSLYEPLCPRGKMIVWLKSLRPQNHWKPTEEQIKALSSAINCYSGISPTNNKEVYILELMKEQLKKRYL